MVVLEKHVVVVEHGVSRPEDEIVVTHFVFHSRNSRNECAWYGGAGDRGVSIEASG